MTKLEEALQIAQSNTFTVPTEWMGYGGEWASSDLANLVKAFMVRFTIQMPRSVAERDAVDWNWVLTTLSNGLTQEYENYYDDIHWGWHRAKQQCGGYQPGWCRTDLRTIGPSDVSGAWETWINQADPWDKEPFDIVTPDTRISEYMTPQTDGKYIEYLGTSPFPASRGIWTFSSYIDDRFNVPTWVGSYPDFVEAEVDFIRAEAWYRLGQYDKVREVVNKYRANGDLPPFTGMENPDTPDMCIPQNADGTCGNLWEALKYEKRIENYHYGSASEFMDDRGWGDLESGTWLELPVPGEELLLLLMEIYTFGGNAGNAAPSSARSFTEFANDFSPEALAFKRQALDARLRDRNVRPDQVGPVR
jgi:hypothetical protein